MAMGESSAAVTPLTLPGWRTWAAGIVLAVPTATVLTAGAGLVLAVGTIPAELLSTHDVYLSVLAVSYGSYAAAISLQTVIWSTLLWALVHPLWRRLPAGIKRSSLALVGGVGAACLGMVFATIPVLTILAVPWRYGPTLPINATQIAVAALAGLCASGIALWRASRTTTLPSRSWWQTLQQTIGTLAWFAFPLALVLEIWTTILAAQGRI